MESKKKNPITLFMSISVYLEYLCIELQLPMLKDFFSPKE